MSLSFTSQAETDLYVCICQPLHTCRMRQKVNFFMQCLTRFAFRVFLLRLVVILRLKSPVFPTILPITGARIVRFILFPKILTFCEMQTASSRIWTWVTMSIFSDDTHYTMITFDKIYITVQQNHFLIIWWFLIWLHCFFDVQWISLLILRS